MNNTYPQTACQVSVCVDITLPSGEKRRVWTSQEIEAKTLPAQLNESLKDLGHQMREVLELLHEKAEENAP